MAQTKDIALIGGLALGAILLFKSKGLFSSAGRDTFTTERFEIRSDKISERFDTFKERQETRQLRQDRTQAKIDEDIERIEDKSDIKDTRREGRKSRTIIRQDARTSRLTDRKNKGDDGQKIKPTPTSNSSSNLKKAVISVVRPKTPAIFRIGKAIVSKIKNRRLRR